MEDNKTSDIPLPCTNGCGFYGNPIFQNMCSKCFGQQQKSNENLQAVALPVTTKATIESHSSLATSSEESSTIDSASITQQPSPIEVKQDQDQDDTQPTATTEATAAVVPLEEDSNKEDKPVQKNKGRCFACRTKIPLTKQLTNKCRCDYVFCDSHRYPDKHECMFDHASMDKGILAKNNPKLNDRPRGGRSFQRLDSF
ncbi:hypothetical protein [Absidia glauca]|uniref:AN1-type domain-containing protein n=1 Tax=Absidia glauca TaxID=4829 RepID=A0A168NN72_ABSGL|nr:hypothetical protein [Absidia glauca]